MKERAYLKIGMYQSIAAVPVPPDPTCDLVDWIPGKRLRFNFTDSGEKHDDGIPIWVADSLEVIEL